MAVQVPTVEGEAGAAKPDSLVPLTNSRAHPPLVRAKAPQPPASTPQTRKADAAQAERRRLQESIEKTHMLRGLLLLAVLVLLGSMLHAGSGRVFVPGWWRQW